VWVGNCNCREIRACDGELQKVRGKKIKVGVVCTVKGTKQTEKIEKKMGGGQVK